MKFVSSREIRVNPGPVLDAVTHGHEVVITSRGKPVALMMGVNDDDLEETVRLVRRARAQGAVSRMRRAAAGRGSDAESRGRPGLGRSGPGGYRSGDPSGTERSVQQAVRPGLSADVRTRG